MIWYLADLLPASKGMFGPDFYPEERRGTKAQVVFFKVLDEPQQRVLVCSRTDGKWVRIITAEVAPQVIQPRVDMKYGGPQKATKADATLLDAKSVEIMGKFI